MAVVTLDQLLAMRALCGSEAPAWSPDGSWIAWISSLGGQPAIWSIASGGGPLQRLSVESLGGGLLTAYQFQWSPDGRYLAFAGDASGADEVWQWSAADGRTTRLTHAYPGEH